MYPYVPCQSTLFRKSLAAIIRTSMGSFSSVLFHVSLQAKTGAKTAVTTRLVTLEWLSFLRDDDHDDDDANTKRTNESMT